MPLLAKKDELYIKDTNRYLKKLEKLSSLRKDAILCTIDIVVQYSNMSREEGLASIRKHLGIRKKKEVTTETLVELTDTVLKTTTFSS